MHGGVAAYHLRMSESRKGWRGETAMWFALTTEERRFLAGVLGLALLGLAARYAHLKREPPAPYTPPAAAEESP